MDARPVTPTFNTSLEKRESIQRNLIWSLEIWNWGLKKKWSAWFWIMYVCSGNWFLSAQSSELTRRSDQRFAITKICRLRWMDTILCDSKCCSSLGDESSYRAKLHAPRPKWNKRCAAIGQIVAMFVKTRQNQQQSSGSFLEQNLSLSQMFTGM